MRITLLCVSVLMCTGVFAQEHFSGINTSRRVGLLNASLNPAELVNLSKTCEVNILNFSANVSNNKITFGDLVSGSDDFESKLFSGNEPVNLRADIDIMGPAFGIKINKWAFAITSAAKVKANIVDVDVNLGNAVTSSNVNPLIGTSIINTNYNQRAAATTWGEISLSAARELYNDNVNKLSAGVTFNLLFPGSFANMSADRFRGNIVTVNGDSSLTDTQANLNFAYSGSLANDFTDTGNYSEFFAGGLNGFSTDIGVNYQWLDPTDSKQYKINAGLSVKNLGSMTFKDNNNSSNNYRLNIPEGEYLDLDQFQNVTNIEEIEDILVNSGFLTTLSSNRDFKVQMPALLAAYADVRLYRRWYVTGYLQQELKKDDANDQIAQQNLYTITPRYSASFFEAYVPLSVSDIAGFTAGLGFRLGGFFIGSGSILSAGVSDTQQADFYMGFRFGI
ncbi:hypothetical protein GR160_01790 [Flavobacterium sp. Sd200]|uniref:hypothetical protein n=1 Tax=Flavobacterium sp. Sd200 TaxID=2692211 RepID=UPI00136BBCC4|nr:hypothetical protein [Flavobacterium sp. Sd200]MXN89946.1 hypothetical protein [Flavobacterium sp. Sd200]